MNEKTSLREKFKKVLRNISFINKVFASDTIVNKVLNLPEFKNANSVLLFISTKNEVDTAKIVDYCFQNGKKVYVPFISTVEIGEIKSLKDLYPVLTSEAMYYQPDKRSSEYKLDITLVPGMAFDFQNFRLGKGGGWYDQFFAKNPNIFKVGLCFKDQLVESIPHTSHDIPMDLVLTN